jgi:hypothetical protein
LRPVRIGTDLVLDLSSFYNPPSPMSIRCSEYPTDDVAKAVKTFLQAIGPGQKRLHAVVGRFPGEGLQCGRRDQFR